MKRIILLFVLPLVIFTGTALADDCGSLDGNWSGSWQIFPPNISPEKWKVSASIATDGVNVLIDCHVKDSQSDDYHMHGTCIDDQLSLEGANYLSVSGVFIGNELTLIGDNSSNDSLEIHLVKE